MIDHLWYLNEELVTMAIFNHNVSITVKKEMIEASKNWEASITKNQRYQLAKKKSNSLLEKNVGDFVSIEFLKLFKIFDLPYDVLEKDVLVWPSDESYKGCFFETLKVTNDVSEQGIAQIEEYNNYLTKDTQQLQYLLHVVREHR